MTGALGKLASRPWFAVVLVGGVAFALAAGISGWVRLPVPQVHDEFGYLLQADTFRHGRLTNPTHPLWVHFESFHIFHQPTYTSRYPPGQGMLYAVGWLVGGSPLVGVWLGAALACGAVCWALLGWTRPRWALIGGLLMAVHPSMLDWGQRYLGGALPVFGGALVIGAWRRLVRRPEAAAAVVMGLGMLVLAHTRPYEGAVLSLIAMGGLGLCWRAPGIPWKAVAIIAALAAVTLGTVGYYSWRVTGDAVRLPWAHYHELYGVARTFVWQAPRPPPEYRHAVMRDFHADWELRQYKHQRTWPGFRQSLWIKVKVYCQAWFRLWPLVIFVVAGLGALGRDRWVRWAVGGLFVYTGAVMLVVGVQPYYVATGFSLMMVLAMDGARRIWVWQCRARRGGMWAVRVLLVVCALGVIPWCIRRARRPMGWPQQRAAMLAELQQDGRQHLVVVRYAPDHNVHAEWVYNEADIDAAPVVWARAMGPTGDQPLLEYFKDRQVWLLDADAHPPALRQYGKSTR